MTRHAEASPHQGLQVPGRRRGEARAADGAVRAERRRQEQLPGCAPVAVPDRRQLDAPGGVRRPAPRQAARVVPHREGGRQGPDRAGAAHVLHRGRSGVGGSGRRYGQSVHSEHAPFERPDGVGERRQATLPGECAKPAVPHRDRDAAEDGRVARRRRTPGRPDQQGRPRGQAEAVHRAPGREDPRAARRPAACHGPRPVSGPQHPVDAALSAAPSPPRRGAQRTGGLAVPLPGTARTDAGRQPRAGGAGHRIGGRRARRFPQHRESGRARAVPLRREGTARH